MVFGKSFLASEGASTSWTFVPTLPSPSQSSTFLVSTSISSHPVSEAAHPNDSPDLVDSDTETSLEDAAASSQREKTVPGWLFSMVSSSGISELPTLPVAPYKAGVIQIGLVVVTLVALPQELSSH